MARIEKKSNNINSLDEKTYSIKTIIITVFVFMIMFMSLIFIRDYKADILVLEIKELDKEIKELNKQAEVLKAEEIKYSAPNRLTAIGFDSGLNEITSREDIIYLKINSD